MNKIKAEGLSKKKQIVLFLGGAVFAVFIIYVQGGFLLMEFFNK